MNNENVAEKAVNAEKNLIKSEVSVIENLSPISWVSKWFHKHKKHQKHLRHHADGVLDADNAMLVEDMD